LEIERFQRIKIQKSSQNDVAEFPTVNSRKQKEAKAAQQQGKLQEAYRRFKITVSDQPARITD
jgi:hypothetical protein